MIQTLLLACALLQDPKPAPRTVEERLKELDEKLTALEKKQRELSKDNASMEKRIADGKAARENAMRLSAKYWVQHVAKPLDLTEKQAADLENLRYDWTVEDRERPADVARWKAREAALREKVSAEQASRLARTVRGDQEATIKAWIRMFAQKAKLDPEKTAALEHTAVGTMEFEEGVLLLEAHPDEMAIWTRIGTAVESALPKVSPPLTEAERAALLEGMGPWKPRRP